MKQTNKQNHIEAGQGKVRGGREFQEQAQE